MLIDHINNLTSYESSTWLENLRSGTPTAAFGVSESARYFLASAAGKRILYVSKDRLSAISARDEIGYLTGKKAVFLPAKDDVLLYKKFFDKRNYYERIAALHEMRDAFAVTTTVEALCQLMPERIGSKLIEAGKEYSLGELQKALVRFGYRREEFAEEVATFAVRGDIMEVYPVGSDTAYRLDFFGDELERIRTIDEETRKAENDVASVNVLPAIDFFINEDEVAYLERRIDESVKKFKTLSPSMKAHALASELKAALESGDLADPSLGFLLPIIGSSKGNIFDFFDAEAVVFDEPKASFDYMRGIMNEHRERFVSLLSCGEVFDFSFDNILTEQALSSTLNRLPCFSLQNVNTTVGFFSPLISLRFSTTSPVRYTANANDLPSDLINWQKSGYKSIIACGSADRQLKLVEDLASKGVLVTPLSVPNGNVSSGATTDFFTRGFVLHNDKIALIGTCDVFNAGLKNKAEKIKKRRNDTFTAPEVGDFAVHEDYGIGLIRGTQKIQTTDSVKDYIAIEYAEGDVLYIPVENMDKLTKYLGGDNAPQLSRLNGGEFEKIKQRVRESISQMSINLKKLYKERSRLKGFRFSPDNELTKEFDDAFPYELTEDQVKSLAEIKKDMESDKITDRLLLGDVGFGKTEIALRAAFKAVLDLKQVAIVAPTTILTEQHYQTVLKRFENFGVKAGILNRFQNPKKIKETLEKLKSGEINIIIGTHRLFGKDVEFYDLGLLILDEEQRFGVEHKEKLRTLKNNVDTITMSATPIPRTLHMSLTGIRDVSMIMTPPRARIPVQSYVIEESDALIRDAVVKELARNGQTFILYNEVEGIYKFAARIRELVPDAKIVVGHGQMTREELENHIMAFYAGEYDVLIATTIIENGIDIPRANTLIVIDADKLGLFSLYQLKGRVGRSDKMAHAYFTYKAEKVLSDAAYKRLDALMESTELGSGYKIAMRDLEIRGAGNVLGREQHGQMGKIGYELYAKLLREQLGEVTKDFETELDVKLDAYIPETYVSVSSSRLDAYKALAEIRSEADRERVVSSIVELYGPMPEAVENLVIIAELKYLCKKAEIVSLTLTKKGAKAVFKNLNSFADGGVTQAVNAFSERATLGFSANPYVTFSGDNAKETALFVKKFLSFAEEKAKQA